MTENKNATIYDVASAAGVSVKTVSRVINFDKTVKTVNVEKVQQAIDKLNYMPDVSARRLRSKQSYQIALLFMEYSGNFYSNLISSGAMQACDELGFDLLIRPFNVSNDDRINELIEHICARSNPDGFIVIPPLTDNEAVNTALVKHNKPVVQIAPINGHVNTSLNCDEVSASRTAVNHLVSLGHTKIGIVNYLVGHAAGEWRYQGYCEALEQSGIPVQPEFIIQREFELTAIENDIRKMLSSENRPSALFTVNDFLASLVYRVAGQLKLRIPYDLSVVGFDDDPVSEYLWPPLTTVRQPIRELGFTAAKKLIEEQVLKRHEPQQYTLNCELIIRSSCGPLL